MKKGLLWFFVFVLSLAYMCPVRLLSQVTSLYPIALKWQGVSKEIMLNDTLLYIRLESGQYEGP